MKRSSSALYLLLGFASFIVGYCRPVQNPPESYGRESVLAEEKDIVYEDGFEVQTILDGLKINASIYSTFLVPGKDFVYAIDTHSSQVLKLKLPIDENTQITQVAGAEDGEAGYKDGWGQTSLFNHPKALTVDDEGNVYVADVRNCVIRKINHDGVVSTIIGEANVSGFADGEGRRAHFSSDFDLMYIPSMCSLLVSDRGNRKLRLIQLKKPEVCIVYKSSSTFSVGLEGLFVVISVTTVMSTVSVWACQNVNLREKLAGLQRVVPHRLMWRRSSDEVYTPLQDGGLPQLPPNGMQPPLQTRGLRCDFPERLPDLIDLSYDTPAANEPRQVPAISDDAHHRRGPDDPAAHHGELRYTHSAPASLVSDRDEIENHQSLTHDES